MSDLQQQLEMLEYKRFKDRRHGKRRGAYFDDAAAEQELNLVAMMDMLTILLVFLLKSYSVSAMSIPVGEDQLSVPMSSHIINPKEAVKLTVTGFWEGQAVIAVEEKVVLELDEKVLAGLKKNAKNRNYLIKDLQTALLSKAKSIQEMGKVNESIVFDHKILIIADKDTPYWLVTSVLFSAAEAGFDQYNLVALREEQ